MQALVNVDGDVVVVQLSGRVDIETAEPFRAACTSRFSGKNVVFDFAKLGFVGSSGILPFLETMQKFHDAHPEKLKFSSVGSEFRRVFAATPLNTVKVYESYNLAAQSYSNPAIVAIELVSASEQGQVSASAPQGFLSFKVAAEDVPTAANEAYEED